MAIVIVHSTFYCVVELLHIHFRGSMTLAAISDNNGNCYSTFYCVHIPSKCLVCKILHTTHYIKGHMINKMNIEVSVAVRVSLLSKASQDIE